MTLREALRFAASESNRDPALDLEVTGTSLDFLVLYVYLGYVEYAGGCIPDCNIQSHADFLERIFTPMIKAIPTEQQEVVLH